MDDLEFPRIVERHHTRLSQWVTVVEKVVAFSADAPLETYHCLTQSDYVGVFAITPEKRIPIVRQFRPAVEAFMWEFPAGTVDAGETPEDAARRELREEAGLQVDELVNLGCFVPDTGRLQVHSHAFFARASPVLNHSREPGLELAYVDLAELRNMIRTMQFRHQLHLAIYAAALVHNVGLDA